MIKFKTTFLLVFLGMCSMVFAAPGFGRLDRSGLMPRQGIHSIVVAASNSPQDVQTTADYLCDGTEDEVEIQAAINSLGSAGGVVKLAVGTYNTAARIDLDDNVEIVGSGWNTIIDAANFDDRVIRAEQKSQVAVKNLKVDFTSREIDTASPQALYFNESDNISVEWVWVIGYGDGSYAKGSGDCITFRKSDDILVDNCRVQGGWHNLMLNSGCKDAVINNIVSKYAGVEHVLTEWAYDSTHDGTRGERITINNVVGDGAGQHGIYVADHNNVTISNCTIRNTRGDGLKLLYTDNVTVNNFINHNTASNDSLRIEDTATKVSISNSQFLDPDSTGTYGAHISGSEILLTGCAISGSESNPGIRLEGATDVSFIGCDIIDMPYNIGIQVMSDANHVTFDGCHINDVGAWYVFDVDGDNVIVSNCQITDNGVANTINLDAGTGHIIKGNIIDADGCEIFDVESGVTELIISDNIFKNTDTFTIDAQQVNVSGNVWQSTKDTPSYLINFQGNSENAIVIGNVAPSSLYGTGFITSTGTDIDDVNNVN